MEIKTAQDAIEVWQMHDGWQFADREAAWKWMFEQGRIAERVKANEELDRTRAVLRWHIKVYRVADEAWDKEAETDRLMEMVLPLSQFVSQT